MKTKEAQKIVESFGWCGCGAPDLALEVVQQVLQAYHDYWEIQHQHDLWDKNSYEVRTEKLKQLVPGGNEYIVLYLLDNAGLMEHGGSVGGGWLTTTGKEFLAYLNDPDSKALV